jgi:hypothetical protein
VQIVNVPKRDAPQKQDTTIIGEEAKKVATQLVISRNLIKTAESAPTAA